MWYWIRHEDIGVLGCALLALALFGCGGTSLLAPDIDATVEARLRGDRAVETKAQFIDKAIMLEPTAQSLPAATSIAPSPTSTPIVQAGDLLWRYDIGPQSREGLSDAMYSSPVVADGVVYVGSVMGYVYALDAYKGDQLWRHETLAAVYSSPAVADGVVYVGDGRLELGVGHVHALDTYTGNLLWRYETNGVVHSSPVVAGGILYVGDGNGYVHALDAYKGERLWRYELPIPEGTQTLVGAHFSPVVADSILYVGSAMGYIYALDAYIGELFWRETTRGSVHSSPVVADSILYVGLGNGYVYALDAYTNDRLWRKSTHARPGGGWRGGYQDQNRGLYSSPVVADGVVYVGDGLPELGVGHVHALDAYTGDMRWIYETDGVVHSSPAVADSILYVRSENGHVYALGTMPAPTTTRTPISQ